MKKLFYTSIVSILFLVSCSNEDIDDDPLLGIWTLAEWNVSEGFDINNDGTISTNLLNEIECSYSETLFFEPNNVVSLNTTFNPVLEINQLNNTNNEYTFNVECDTEGVASLATFYTKTGNNITIGESTALISGNKISIVFEDRLQIYSEDGSQIVETKDLTLVYQKQ